MKTSEYQRIELALQAAAKIAPVQFHIRYHRFSPLLFKQRLIAALLAGVLIGLSLFWLMSLAVLIAVLAAVAVAYGVYRSALSVWVWPKGSAPKYGAEPVNREVNQSQITISACRFPPGLSVQASQDLNDIEELETLAAQLQADLAAGGPIEAVVKAVELSLLAVLPIAATLPPLQTPSTINIKP